MIFEVILKIFEAILMIIETPFKIFKFTWCGHRPKAGKLQMNQSPCLV